MQPLKLSVVNEVNNPNSSGNDVSCPQSLRVREVNSYNSLQPLRSRVVNKVSDPNCSGSVVNALQPLRLSVVSEVNNSNCSGNDVNCPEHLRVSEVNVVSNPNCLGSDDNTSSRVSRLMSDGTAPNRCSDIDMVRFRFSSTMVFWHMEALMLIATCDADTCASNATSPICSSDGSVSTTALKELRSVQYQQILVAILMIIKLTEEKT